MDTSAGDRALKMIANCVDAKSLRQIAANARWQGMSEVARAADLRLYEVLPSLKPGTLEHDVWRSIHALEDTLANERARQRDWAALDLRLLASGS